MKRVLLILAALSTLASSAVAVTVQKTGTTGTYTYYVATPSSPPYRVVAGDGVTSRFDIAIIGDGYVDSMDDQGRFTQAAETFVEGLFNISPYKESRGCINVYVINLVSTDSGIDDPDAGLVHNTALDCSFVTGSMQITGSLSKADEAVHLSGAPFDIIYVLVNDSKGHDGSWANYSTKIAFSSDMYTWGTVMAHELGHVLGKLADEYRAPECLLCGNCAPCPPDCANKVNYKTYTASWAPAEPNITIESDPALVPWSDLLTTQSFPTTVDSVCEGDVIGRWEGANNYCFKIYRPREYCLMDGVTGDDPLIDDFCPVCARAITTVLAAYYNCTGP